MAGVRSTAASLIGINSENNVPAKSGLHAKKAGPAGVRSTRTVMGEIGNVAGGQFARSGKALQKPIKGTAKPKVAQGAPQPLVREAGQKPEPRFFRKKKASSSEKSDLAAPLTKVPEVDQDVEMESPAPAVPEGFSTKNLGLFNIEDIDEEDKDDPQLVVDYINEIYEYLRMMERKQSIKKDYLDGRVGAVIPKMRTVLVEWMVEVHKQFSLLQETLYLSVAIVDRYLQVAAEKVPRKALQLVGTSAMFIASKYEEMYAPEIGDFVYITDNAYTEKEIKDMEIKIMTVLNFEMGRPLPLHFLRRNSKAGQVDGTTHTLAKYVLELTILEYGLAHVLPSEIAAASLAFALRALDDEGKAWSELWDPTLEYFSQYRLQDIAQTLQQVASMVLATTRAPEKAKLMAIRTKYADKKFGKIATYQELTSKAVEDMAKGIF